MSYGGYGYGGGDTGGAGYGGGGYGGGGGGGGGGYGGGGGGGGYGGGGGGYGGGGDGGAGYGGSGGGGGGGFMQSGGGATGAGYSQGGGFGDSGGGDGTRGFNETLTAVTIKQVNEAETEPGTDKLIISGTPIEQLTLVARITKVDVQMTMIVFTLDDCTGLLEGSHMLPADYGTMGAEFGVQKRERLKEGAWVRVVGIAEQVGGARRLAIYKVRAVDDSHEIIYHRLDVIKTHLAATRSKPGAAGGIAGKPVSGNQPGTGGSMYLGETAEIGPDGLSFTPLQRKVYEYIKAREPETTENGIGLDYICRDVGGGASRQDIAEIMEGFMADGHVYTTIDEEHYLFCRQ